MRKLIFKILLTLVILLPVSAMAGVSVHVNIPLPPPIVFAAPPEVVPLPESDVYVVPDVQEEIFFSGGWWWRPWEGRWYRSHYYDRGWAHYRGVPAFHRNIPPGWRDDFRNHRWQGQPWEHQRVNHGDLNRNWRGWEKNKHWRSRPGVRGGEGPGFRRDDRRHPGEAGPAKPDRRRPDRRGPGHQGNEEGHGGR
jgi:hypothetical protein